MTLVQYIIQEGINIKGFSDYAIKNIEYSKEILDGAKGDYNNLDNAIKDVLNKIAGDLQFDFDDFDKNKAGGDEEGDGDKRAKDDGQVNTQSNSDEGGDDKGEEGEGEGEDKKEEEEDEETINLNKQKIALVKMGKNSGELISKSNADDFIAALFKKYNIKSEDFLDSFIRIAMSAADKGFDWVPESVIGNENLNELMHFVAFAKGISDTSNKQQILDMQKYMGND